MLVLVWDDYTALFFGHKFSEWPWWVGRGGGEWEGGGMNTHEYTTAVVA